jgi:hypothetical protein
MSLANDGNGPSGQEPTQEAGQQFDTFHPSQVCELCAQNVSHTVANCGAFKRNYTPEEQQRNLEQAQQQIDENIKQFLDKFYKPPN